MWRQWQSQVYVGLSRPCARSLSCAEALLDRRCVCMLLALHAAIGRGMNEVAFRAHAIQASMEQMLHAAALPILSDVQLVVPGVSQLRLCPDPIPDVFVGQPLLVSGKYAGDWPEKVYLIGTMPSGEGGCCCCCLLMGVRWCSHTLS